MKGSWRLSLSNQTRQPFPQILMVTSACRSNSELSKEEQMMKLKNWISLLIILIFITPVSVDTGWRFVSPMPMARYGHDATLGPDGKLYVMGGRRRRMRAVNKRNWVPTGKVEIADSVECYDPSTNKWEYRKPMPMRRFLFAAVVGPDDRIYTFGEMGEYNKGDKAVPSFDDTHVYDPKTDSWSSLTPMPRPRKTHDCVLGTDGKIYVLGGSIVYNGPPLRDVLIYDPVKDKWKKGPKMKLPRSTLAAVATPDGKIYAIGGTDVGAYEKRRSLNVFLPEKKELYTGKVQETVEVLDVSK